METEYVDILELTKRATAHLEKRYQEIKRGEFGPYTPFDYQPFLDLLADNAVFSAPAPPGTAVYGTEFRGKEAITKLFLEEDPTYVDSDSLRVESRPEYFANSNRAVVLTAYTYTIKKSATVARNKDIALVLDFMDGKIVRATEIQDMSEWTSAHSES